MSPPRRFLLLAALPACLTMPLPAQAAAPEPSVHFVVIGHPRGSPSRELNPKLGELIVEVQRLRPAFVVITGDIIYGEYRAWPPDSAHIERQWHEVDSAFATLGVPVYRVPGNHDIHDPVTAAAWARRYGPLPQAVDVHGYRLLLLSSARAREAADTAPPKFTGGVDLDAAQLAFLRDTLGRGVPGSRTFVFLHHLLWWQPPDGAWWREVHPLLAAAGVPAVFTGDYGPLKFSVDMRDGVRYFQTAIDDNASVAMQRARVNSRVLSYQFDNFLDVRASGDSIDVRVHVVAAMTSGQFTPQHHAAVSEPLPPVPLWRRIIGRPGLLALLLIGLAAVGVAGYATGRAHARRPAA